MSAWKYTLKHSIETLLTNESPHPFVINVYGQSWEETHDIIDNPAVICIHQNDSHTIDAVTTKIILLLSVDILQDDRIDYYFNVEENYLLPRTT